MRFLVDAQLPPTLARWLSAQGHETEHVGDIGMQAAPDAVIWDHAMAFSATIITKDEDFAQRKLLTGKGASHRLDQVAEHHTARASGSACNGFARNDRGAGAR